LWVLEIVTMDYQVTIRLESQFASHGSCWVARDEKRDWRCYCKEHFANTAAESAPMMFHADEIVSVEDKGDSAVVVIKGY
jgi:hypothetical protein